jgi:hypothetical protein
MKTVKFLSSVCAAVLATGVAHADLIINEVVDGDLPGGLPKWVELRNTGATTVDPTAFSFGNYNNGGTVLGGGATSPLTGSPIAAGGYYIILYQAVSTTTTTYSSVYGSSPDFYMGGAFVNGDDVLSLQDAAGATTVDEYGELGVDGSGEVWEYLDGYSYRCGTSANGGTFDPTDWVYGGVKSLEDELGGNPAKIALLLTLTTPGAQTTTITTSAENYCTPGSSANGCTPTISAVGGASTTASSGFIVSVTGVEGAKDGLFFYGQNGMQLTSSWGTSSSFQCVMTPVKRGGLLTGIGTAGACDGCFSQDLNARWCSTCPKPLHLPSAGKMQIQFWYRDPFNTSNQTTSLSDAIEVDVL